MKANIISIWKLLFVFLFLFGAVNSPAQQSTQSIKIGIYDSRAVAIAYANSEGFQKYVTDLKADYNKAKGEKNEELLKKLEKEGPFLQQLLHQQSFSSSSVNNIIEKIKDKLPGIAASTGVKIIISKWELSFMDSSLETVDVTDQLAGLFNPNEKVLKWIEEMKKQNPIPIEKL